MRRSFWYWLGVVISLVCVWGVKDTWTALTILGIILMVNGLEPERRKK